MKIDHKQIIKDALTGDSKISDCYKHFHNYSFYNQWLACIQLIKAEPINTFNGWKKLGRQVKKGSKAIALCVPSSYKNDDDEIITYFKYVKRWFPLSMTEGKEFKEIKQYFDLDKKLKDLGIDKIEFESIKGNSQGYALPNKMQIAINPLAKFPFQTAIHEIAHCLMHKDKDISKEEREVEAELVSFIVSNAVGAKEKLEESRGYIQHYYNDFDINHKKIVNTVNTILK